MKEYRIKKMTSEKRKEYSAYYQKVFRNLRDNEPKNFWWKVFLSGVYTHIFYIIMVNIILTSSIILCF